MSEEVAAIYATLALDKSGFDTGLAEAQAQMAAMAASMDATSANITAASAEGAAAFDAAAADISAAADVTAADVDTASVAMDGGLLSVVASAAAVAGAFLSDIATTVVDAMATGVSAIVSGATAMVGALVTIASAALGAATTLTSLLIPALIGGAIALGVFAAAAAVAFLPFTAGAAIIGGLIGYFDILNGKAGSAGKQLEGWAKGVFRYIGSIATAVSGPVIHALAGLLSEFDKYVHTTAFHQQMKQWADDLVKDIGYAERFVEYIIANWPAIVGVAKKIVDAGLDVAAALVWLYNQYRTYWPKIKQTVEEFYNWFKATIWPGLHTVMVDIWNDLSNLWNGAKQAWPGISSAISTAWGIIKPILNFLIGVLGKVQDGISWLSKNSGPAFSAFGSAVSGVMSGIQSVVSGVATAIEDTISAAEAAYNWLVGHSGSTYKLGGGASNTGTKGPRMRATGGVLNPGEWSWVGERGPELIKAGPSGASVTANGRGHPGGGAPIYLVYQGYGSQADARRFARWLAPELARIPTITTRTTR